MSHLISQLFINATILISFITLGNYFFKEKGVNLFSPLYTKIFISIASGILGCLLIVYGVQITPEIRVDFRSIPIIIMALYVSFIPTIIASLVICIFRFIYLGISQSSMIASLAVIIIGVGCGLVGKLNLKIWAKWLILLLLVYTVSGTAIAFLLVNSSLLADVLVSYGVGTALVYLIMYYFLEYLVASNRLYRQMKEELKIDFLTGLNNVRQFDKISNRVLQKAKKYNEQISLLFIDIDYFKKVNDAYGHLKGDEILKEFAVLLAETCRNGDIISRNGGEEFSIFLLDCPFELAMEVAERIRNVVELYKFKVSSEIKINLTISIGVSSFPETTDDVGNLLEQADFALYNAKRAGRNRVSANSSRN